MSKARATFSGLLLLLPLSCTNDYDAFSFNGGGPIGGNGTGGSGASTVGGNGGDGGTPQGGSPATGGGGTTSDGGNGGSPATGGGGSTSDGGAPPVNLPCGNGTFCDQGDVCCIADGGEAVGTCKGSCNGSEATLRCNGPSDCPGEKCCLDTSGGNYDSSQCAATCSDLILCDGGNPDPDCQDACMPPGDLPTGYAVCTAP